MKSLGNANGVTAGGAFFNVVRDSKTSGSQLCVHFVASEPIDVTTPFETIPGIQRFLPPTKKKTENCCRSADEILIT